MKPPPVWQCVFIVGRVIKGDFHKSKPVHLRAESAHLCYEMENKSVKFKGAQLPFLTACQKCFG